MGPRIRGPGGCAHDLGREESCSQFTDAAALGVGEELQRARRSLVGPRNAEPGAGDA